ncbi:YncE family protein [Brevibacillus dissolubilis]|uniref:YncE family protein n=1 Tax=Brevibacillus dissolubilis TaxID=1844116 RepID=UPI001115E176|nr:hypothetical protein [Brevibacillus dissolubilis]
MRQLQKSLIGLLCSVLLLTSLFMPSAALAFPKILATQTFPAPFHLSEWLLDDDHGFIYAATAQGDLYFIRTRDLAVVEKLSFGSKGSVNELAVQGETLYAAQGASKQVSLIDLAAHKVTATLSLSDTPATIAVHGDTMWFAPAQPPAPLYEYSLSTKKEKKIAFGSSRSGALYRPLLTYSPEHQTLYIAESGISGANLFAVNPKTYEILHHAHQSSDQEYTAFTDPIIDGEDVFHAGYRFDADQLGVVHGKFGTERTTSMKGVQGKYVLTKEAVYDRDTFQKLRDLPFAGNASLDQENHLYLFSSSFSGPATIYKMPLELSKKKPDPAITKGNSLTLPLSMKKWAYDETTQKLGVIFRDSNRVAIINSATMKMEKEVPAGSSQADIAANNGKLYVSLYGTKLAIIDLTNGAEVKEQILPLFPDSLAVDDNQLFFGPMTKHMPLQSLSLNDHKIRPVPLPKPAYMTVYHDFAVDADKKLLYLAGSSALYTLRTTDFTLVEQNELRDFYNYPIVLDDQYVYLDKNAYDSTHITDQKMTYPSEVIAAKDGYVFTRDAVYDRDSGNLLSPLPGPIADVIVTDDHNILLYNAKTYTITRYSDLSDLIKSESKIKSLQFETKVIDILQGQSYYPALIATYENGSKRNVAASATWETEPDAVKTEKSVMGLALRSPKINPQGSTVTATYQGLTAQAIVKTGPYKVATEISIKSKSKSKKISVGQRNFLTITAKYKDNTKQDITRIATVYPESSIIYDNGDLVAVREGTDQIGIRHQDHYSIVSVTVSPAAKPAQPAVKIEGLILDDTAWTESDGSISNNYSYTIAVDPESAILKSSIAKDDITITLPDGVKAYFIGGRASNDLTVELVGKVDPTDLPVTIPVIIKSSATTMPSRAKDSATFNLTLKPRPTN